VFSGNPPFLTGPVDPCADLEKTMIRAVAACKKNPLKSDPAALQESQMVIIYSDED